MADSTMEEREDEEETMISSTGRTLLRKAHFLKPSVTSINDSVEAPPPHSKPTYKKVPFNVSFYKLQNTPREWVTWVRSMQSLHHITWKKAGIFDAIISSTSIIRRNESLIYGFVEKWCPVTNTFVFPWGEATMTLEDMIVLGGYSVLGDSVLIAPSPSDSEMEETVKKLLLERSNIIRTKVNKAGQGAWMKIFMNRGSEIEHEAFLAYWLSRFVFPMPTIDKRVLSIAVHLSRGVKIALAPPVLASIYQCLSLLKSAITRKIGNRGKCHDQGACEVVVSAPLALVQVWIWERFPNLRPIPNVKPNDTRMAQWHDIKKLEIEDLSLKIDSAAEIFEWRPYVKATDSFFHIKIYADNEYWVSVETDLDVELEGLIRCLRTSELVGLEANCIEQYLPHRVAMQFGMDQGIPGYVARENASPEIAWSNYNRPIRDKTLYVPPRLFVPGVTTRYLKWWKERKCCFIGRTVKDTKCGSEEILEVTKDNSTGKETEINCGVNGIADVDGKSSSQEILVDVTEDSTGDLNGMTALDGKSYSAEISVEVREDDSIGKETENICGMNDMADIYGKSGSEEIPVDVAEDDSIRKETEITGGLNDTAATNQKSSSDENGVREDDSIGKEEETNGGLNGMAVIAMDWKISSEEILAKVGEDESLEKEKAINVGSSGMDATDGKSNSDIILLEVVDNSIGKKTKDKGPNGTEAGLHGKASLKSSKMIFIKLEGSGEDVPPGFSPKRKRAIEGSSVDSYNSKPLEDGRNFCPGEVTRKKSSSFSTPTGAQIGFHGKASLISSKPRFIERCGNSRPQTGNTPPPKLTRETVGTSGDLGISKPMKDVKNNSHSMPQEVSKQTSSSYECAKTVFGDSSSSMKSVAQRSTHRDDDDQVRTRSSFIKDNGNFHELTSIPKPAESEVKNMLENKQGIKEVESGDTGCEIGARLEERIVVLENLRDLLKTGKVNHLLMKKSNNEGKILRIDIL